MSRTSATINEIKSAAKYACVGGPFGSELTRSDYVDEGIPIIRGGNLPDDVDFYDNDFVFVSEQKADSLAANTARPGDIVFTQRGTLGQIGIIPDGAQHERYIVSQSQMKLTVNEEKALPRFVYYYFRQKHVVEIIKRRAITSGVPHINLGILKSLTIDLPAVATQTGIVSVLDAYTATLANNRRRIELLKRFARLLFKEWFVHLRFPDHEHSEVVDGVPEGWERGVLGDLLTLKRGYDLPEGKRVHGDVPIVSSSGITGFHNEKKAKAPGIVTGRYGTLGEVFFVDRDYWPLNTALYASNLKGNPPCFLVYFLEQALATIQSDKAAVPGLNRNALHAMRVLAPPVVLRQEFEEIAALNYQQIQVLNNSSEKLRAARDLLLPRLMDGRISV
jgi:type I restriction enzyme, S subunit